MPESTKSPAGETNDDLLVNEFRQCLVTMSYVRAGWDYALPLEQRAKENGAGRDALSRARMIWKDHPALHDELRVVFMDANPLATMLEIENSAQASIRGGEA